MDLLIFYSARNRHDSRSPQQLSMLRWRTRLRQHLLSTFNLLIILAQTFGSKKC